MEVGKSWMEVAQTGNVDALYEIFGLYPNILDDIDEISFIDTPLHIAASAGHTYFALEVLMLKRSLGKKLNSSGFCPLVLAFQSGQTATVFRLVDFDPELVRVKGKRGFTPLHFVTHANDVNLLQFFLFKWPESIEDVTIRRETAVHIAVRNGNVRALEVLLVRLKLTENEKILNGTDDEGDTVLHVAVSTNIFEVVSLLIKKVDINIKNLKGLTALDINMVLPNGRGDGRIREILHSELLSCKETFKTRFLRELKKKSPVRSMEEVNALLVIAALIVTATYQALLNPPGGISSEPNKNTNSTATTTTATEYPTGRVHMDNGFFYSFMFFNTAAFFASITMIWVLLKYIIDDVLLIFPLIALIFCYTISAFCIAPATASDLGLIIIIFLALFSPYTLYLLTACYRSRPKVPDFRWPKFHV